MDNIKSYFESIKDTIITGIFIIGCSYYPLCVVYMIADLNEEELNELENNEND